MLFLADSTSVAKLSMSYFLLPLGYRIVGSHSGVKLCRWTKSMLRGRGGCYKHTFYGIESHRCMETTPSLACANKCVFCWRLVGVSLLTRSWSWATLSLSLSFFTPFPPPLSPFLSFPSLLLLSFIPQTSHQPSRYRVAMEDGWSWDNTEWSSCKPLPDDQAIQRYVYMYIWVYSVQFCVLHKGNNKSNEIMLQVYHTMLLFNSGSPTTRQNRHWRLSMGSGDYFNHQIGESGRSIASG